MGAPKQASNLQATRTLPALDCAKDFANWEQAWTFGKKRFCCKTQRRGCVEFVANPAKSGYDDNLYCNKGLAKWEQTWSSAKKVWCCKYQNVGCEKNLSKMQK